MSVDTAGIKLGSGLAKTEFDIKVNEQVDSVINFSHVVCMMIDSDEAFTASDMYIIDKVLEEVRGLVVVAKKWDLIDEK